MNVVTVKKAAAELRIVWAEVYAPDRPDVQGEYMTAEDIRIMAHRFMAKQMNDAVDVQHDNNTQQDLMVVESFIARDGDPDFIAGSWVVGVYVPDDALWDDVKSGKLNSFSVEALVSKEEGVVELEIPDLITGKTSTDSGHSHTFEVRYSDEGELVGGRTGVSAGHAHTINGGTVTDVMNGHRHKFSSVDNIRIVDGEDAPL